MSNRAAPTAGLAALITHPDKVLFPADGITKGELAAYYEAIAPLMLSHVRNRPVTMERYPAGINAPSFFHKNVSKGFPPWLQRVEVPKRGGSVNHPLINDTPSLLWVVNQNCITPHVWPSRTPKLYQPDICVFDLDPSEEDAGALRAATLAVRDLLAELGLPSWVKTSGSKGFHVVVPLDATFDFDAVASFAHRVGRLLVQREPGLFTQEFLKADRGGLILIDTGRNGYSATYAAPYAVRPKPGAPVSAPCTWDEVEQGSVGPQSFRLRTMAERIVAVADLWAELPKRRRSLRVAIAKLEKLLIGD
jgi:bifunctional non-homologous end joining protein LigD